MPLEAGDRIKHYEIIRKLGQGGMGVVYLARDTKLGRLVAIKLLLRYSGHRIERFLAEARATARCRHDNIVVIHEVDEIRQYPYLVLEYIKGRTLREWMAQREHPSASGSPGAHTPPGPRAPDVVVELMTPVVRALVCAHEHGIVHRDLKPENILLDDAGCIKVLDFGIAKQIEAKRGLDDHGRAGGARRRRWPAPEERGLSARHGTCRPSNCWAGTSIIAPTSGPWASSCTSCSRGAPAGPVLARAALGHREPRCPDAQRSSEKRPDVGALGALIDRCLKKRKAERIGSAMELLAELEALLPGRKALDLGEDESPFAGLSAFQEADAARFFGRDREIAAVATRLRNQPLLAIAGPSGAGKSSFVRAGVIPALKRSEEPLGSVRPAPGAPSAVRARRCARAGRRGGVHPSRRGRTGPPELPDHDELRRHLALPAGLSGRSAARALSP